MVKMASTLMFGPGLTDLAEGINVPRMREERAARMSQILKQQGIPALLVTEVWNLRYLTGFFSAPVMPGASYALFFAEHDPIIFAHAGTYHQVPDQMPWIKHWRIGRCWAAGSTTSSARPGPRWT